MFNTGKWFSLRSHSNLSLMFANFLYFFKQRIYAIVFKVNTILRTELYTLLPNWSQFLLLNLLNNFNPSGNASKDSCCTGVGFKYKRLYTMEMGL